MEYFLCFCIFFKNQKDFSVKCTAEEERSGISDCFSSPEAERGRFRTENGREIGTGAIFP